MISNFDKGGRISRSSGGGLRALLVASVAVVALTGCAIEPTPFTIEESRARASADVAALNSENEPLTAPVSLYEAMARAVKYNLDHRLKVMEAAFASRQLTSANLSMLPQLAANAGYEGRDNDSGSSSRSLLDGTQSLETSTSQDRNRRVYDYGLSWNVLDFGVSYVRAQQQADRNLIIQERRRKVIHNIIQDVRGAYWQAVSAERLLKRIDPLIDRIAHALAAARTIEDNRLQPPRDALVYRRTLLEAMRQIKELRRELIGGKVQLAALMGVVPGQEFTLATNQMDYREMKLQVTLDKIEQNALVYRPELREENYNTRIGEKEVKRAMLSLLPGLNLDVSKNYDSNSFTMNNHWYSWAARVNANLFDTFLNGPARVREAEAAEDVAMTRRLAISMAVLSQAHVSWLAYHQSVSEFRTSNELNAVDSALLDQVRISSESGRGNELELIQAELASVLSELRRDIAFAAMSNAAGRIYVTAGADPLPPSVPDYSVATLASAIEKTMERWERGDLVQSEDIPATTPIAAPEIAPVAAEPAPEPVPVVMAEPTPQLLASTMRWWEVSTQ